MGGGCLHPTPIPAFPLKGKEFHWKFCNIVQLNTHDYGSQCTLKMLFVVVALAVLAAIVFAFLKRRGGSGSGDAPWPFYAKKPLTQPEQILYHRLVAAMPECIVLAHVMGGIIQRSVRWLGQLEFKDQPVRDQQAE